MKYSTIFFDLDDTLINTTVNNLHSLQEIFNKYEFNNYYENFDDFHSVFAPHNLSLWKLYEQNSITKTELKSQRFFVPFRHISSITQEKALEINDAFMFGTAGKKRLIEGATELLDKLKPVYKLVILSNGFEEVQYKKLEKAGLTHYFDKIILSDNLGVNKPHPDLFQHALNVTKACRKETVMIGDNWNSDITGAKNSNIDQIWFNPKGLPAKEFIPTHTVGKLYEIEDILLGR